MMKLDPALFIANAHKIFLFLIARDGLYVVTVFQQKARRKHVPMIGKQITYICL